MCLKAQGLTNQLKTVMIYEVIENICESIFFSGINPGEKLKCGINPGGKFGILVKKENLCSL